MDAVIDFGYSTTTNAPGLSGTTFDVVDGTVYPAPPFDVILYLPGTQPLKATAERGRCTAVVGNTLTVTRDLGGTNQNVQAGWAVDNALTAELLEQIMSAMIPLATVTAAGDLIVGTGAGAVTRLGVGTSGQVLLGGVTPTWGAAPGGTLTNQTSYITANVALTGGTPANITSLSLTAGTWLINSSVLYLDQGSATLESLIDAWIGTTSASTTGAYAGFESSTGENAAGFPGVAGVSFTRIVTLAATTTVYLNAQASQSGQALYYTEQIGSVIPQVTGMTAVKIG